MRVSDLRIVSHPLLEGRLAALRDASTTREQFRAALRAAALLLAVEATRNLATVPSRVQGPLGPADVKKVSSGVVLIPVLRAGLAMLDGFLEIVPDARVGHIGLERDESSLEPRAYYERLPEQLPSSVAFMLDPMLATGGSAVHALTALRAAGAQDLTLVVLVASVAGVQAVQTAHPDVRIVAAAVDPDLDDRGFILPGLGDAGDRTFGT